MAKLAVLFTVVFLLLTVSHARFISSETEHDAADLPKSDSESTNTIFLPTDRPVLEHQKLLDFKHDDNVASDADSKSGDGSAVPLTKINFHPVNRHFPMRPLFPFRQHRHRDHHYRHRNCLFNKRFRHLNPQFHQKRFVSYGNDMILSDERSFDPASRGVIRQIDARWGRFHDDGSESKQRVVFMKHHGHHHHESEHHDQDHEHEDHDQDHDEHDQEHDLRHEDEQEHHDEDHDREHEDNHHKHHRQHHKNHHHGEGEEKDDTEKHEGLVDKFRKLFIHF